MSILNLFKKDNVRKEPTMASKPTWPPTLENSRALRELSKTPWSSAGQMPAPLPLATSETSPVPAAVSPTVSEKPQTKDTIVDPVKAETIPKDHDGLKEYFQNNVFNKPSAFIDVMKVAEKLKTFITDDAVRAKAAFATVVNPGEEQALREKISGSIDQHLIDLEAIRIRVKEQTSGAALARATDFKNKADSIANENSSIDEQVASLHASINRLLAKKLSNTTEIESLTAKVEESKKEAESFGTIDNAAAVIKDDLVAKKAAIGIVSEEKPASDTVK